MPDELEGSTNCKLVELQRLDPRDAIKFFDSFKIEGREAEIREVCTYYEGHPLAYAY